MISPLAAALPHPELHQRVRASFERQGMMLHLGARLIEIGPSLPTSLRGGQLRATGRVVCAGPRITVTGATVVHIGDDGKPPDCAVMQQTLVPVLRTY